MLSERRRLLHTTEHLHSGTASSRALKSKFKREFAAISSQSQMSVLKLLVALVACSLFIAACGDGDDQPATPTIALATAVSQKDSPPQKARPPSLPFLLPCHVDLESAQQSRPAPEATPETVTIRMLVRPYRIEPGNILLRHNRWYRLAIETGSEWHSILIRGLNQRIEYDIPPGGREEVLVQTTRTGVFLITDWRHRSLRDGTNIITVIPEGASASTWNPVACGTINVDTPAVGAVLSTPLVIQGSVTPPDGSLMGVTYIEAWSEGVKLGQVTADQFRTLDSRSEFFITLPSMTPGSHTIILAAYLQNGNVAATVSLPVRILSDPPAGSGSEGFRGFVDFPTENGLQGLPVIVQGWAINPSTRVGTGVGAVEIWNGPRESGRFLTNATYGMYRPDVADAHGEPRFASSGFYAELADLPAGTIDLHFYVRDRESGDYVPHYAWEPPLTRRVVLAEGKVADADWPAALAAAPDGRLFYAELLTGNIRVVQDGKVKAEPFAKIEGVSNFGESGFLGLELHPDFPETPYVYAMYVVDGSETGYPSGQRVLRFRDDAGTGVDRTVIIDNLPATTTFSHNGGRLEFGPDGKLYVTIGDIMVPELSQDPDNLAGTILRYNPDGSIPDDNPTPGSPVFAIGLRNVFGIAFQPTFGRLFATENGPGEFDEVNIIAAGGNYGWPTQMGVSNAEGFVDPIAVYGQWPDTPIGPTGGTFSKERPDLFLFCAFNGFHMRALQLSGPDYTTVEIEMVLTDKCALDVTFSRDGWLYYSTPSAIYRARLDDLLRLHELKLQDEATAGQTKHD